MCVLFLNKRFDSILTVTDYMRVMSFLIMVDHEHINVQKNLDQEIELSILLKYNDNVYSTEQLSKAQCKKSLFLLSAISICQYFCLK
jgi:hypothetical protein